MPRPDVSAMSLDHLLDEYPRVYRDGGKRHEAIRAEILRRFNLLSMQAKAAERDLSRSCVRGMELVAERDAARAEVERLRDLLKRARYVVDLAHRYRVDAPDLLSSIDAALDAATPHKGATK